MSTDVKSLAESREILKDIFLAGVKAVAPGTLIKEKVKIENGFLHVSDQSFELKENVYLVGFGKAVMGMAIVMEYLLGDSLKKGIVSVPSATKDSLWSNTGSFFPKLTSVIEYHEGTVNNQPDDRSLETTHDIIDLVEPLTENDTLIVLISGGGSALLYMPRPVIDREDKLLLCKALQNAGADIKEVNTVRKKLSMVKGGGLARMAYPASVITLILSDIVGDPPDLIASGPTVYSNKAPDQVCNILKKYNLFTSIEGDVKGVITSKEAFNDKPLIDKKTKQFKHVNNIIVGNNTVAIEAASIEARRKKLTPIILRHDVAGDVHDVSLAYTHVAGLICLALDKTLEREEFFAKVKEHPIMPLNGNKVDEIYDLIENCSGEGLLLIGGGEPTVVVTGEGKGGRNQELALHFSLDWLAKIKSLPRFAEYDVIMLSAGTDGQDGPTDAAGAFGYPAIAPILHLLYGKIKSLRMKEVAEKEAKEKEHKDKEAAKEAKQHVEECKLQELSDYLDSVKTEKITEPVETAEKDLDSTAEDADNINNVHPLILQTLVVERILPENALKENDTYNLYSRFKYGVDLLKTGLTGTNVMDLHLIYIRKRKCGCKIDYMEDIKTDIMDLHDLRIDPSAIDKYKKMNERIGYNWDDFWRHRSFVVEDKNDQLKLNIIDDNLADPCCRKERKFPKK